MDERLIHEHAARGDAAMHKLSRLSIAICGVGALGSNLAYTLVKMGAVNVLLLDKDRVESRNVGTQIYGLDDVGAPKVEMLRNRLYSDTAQEVKIVNKELTDKNVTKLLGKPQLIVDVFDNSASRKLLQDYCISESIDCLHAGVNDQYGEIVWNEKYLVPPDVGLDLCDYPLARTLVLLVVAATAEAIMRFLTSGEKHNYSITLGDLKINDETR